MRPDLSFLSVNLSTLSPRLLLRGVRIQLDAVEATKDAIKFRAFVPDRDDGQPRPLEFTVAIPPAVSERVDDPDVALARFIREACATLIAHELAECIINRQGMRVVDPHRRGG